MAYSERDTIPRAVPHLGRENIFGAEEIISYRFNDQTLLQRALTLPNGSRWCNKGLMQQGSYIIPLVLSKNGWYLGRSPGE